MIAGIIKFEKKFMKSQLPTSHKEYKPLHLGTHFDSLGRWKAKAMGADSWYEDKAKEDSEVQDHQKKKAGKRKKLSQKAENDGIKTSTVMFVPSSKGGLLTSMMKEIEEVRNKDTGGRRNQTSQNVLH